MEAPDPVDSGSARGAEYSTAGGAGKRGAILPGHGRGPEHPPVVISPAVSRDRRFFVGLGLVTVLAGLLRLLELGSVPPSLYCDEALHGYEAFSILETGRDSQGRLLPLFFDLFGVGWGEPLYIYLTVPSVALFGLTAFAVRLPAALAGAATVAATGILTALLLSCAAPGVPAAGQGGATAPEARRAGLFAALLMAVSPWPFHLSRIAFQGSLLPLLLAAGFALALFALRRPGRSGAIYLSAVTLGLSLYTYTPVRLILPLLLLAFLVLYREPLWRRGRTALAAAAVFTLLALPIAIFSLTDRGLRRFADVSILSGGTEAGVVPALLRIAGNYLSYHSPGFLLAPGDPNLRHTVAGQGALHPHDLILMVLGVGAALILGGRGARFLLAWLVIYPAAAALTAEPAHAVRAIAGQPALYALAGLGGAVVLRIARRRGRGPLRWVSPAALGLAIALAGISTGLYLRHYFIEYPRYSGPSWQWGLREAYDWIENHRGDHDAVYVTRNEDYPWIHLLFYHRMPPSRFQQVRFEGTPWLFDQEIYYRGDRLPGRLNPIFLLKPWEMEGSGLTPRHRIAYPDGREAFVIAW